MLQFGHGGDAVGDTPSPIWVATPGARFNSATAVTPWVTSPSPTTATASSSSFNSATAVTPWVTPGPVLCLDVAGGRFNSATAVTPWVTEPITKGGHPEFKLQFGHGGDAVGDAGAHTDLGTLSSASIRPRR